MNNQEESDVVDRLLNKDDVSEDYPDTEIGRAAADLMSLRGVVRAELTESDGKPAVAIRINPETADLNNVHLTKVDHGLDIVLEEWDADEGHILRVYRDNPPETDEAWWVVSEELADLSSDFHPAEVLDYWMMERAAPMQLTVTQESWGEHRGVSKQTVSDHVRAVREGLPDD